uniref:MMS19 nucleotide excision repair protein n=1 Tax=Theileria annulata TaxID=5874 RepID=A0A3B0N1Y7_THEAN
MSNLDTDLDDIVRSYLSTHDIYKQNSYRNSILLSANRSGTTNFIKILNNIYEEGDDPVDRKNVLNLLYEVVSRTEQLFDTKAVLELLLKFLKLTICVQLSLATMRAMIERHSNSEPTFYENVQQFHEVVSHKKISEYPQKCRMDYLFISDYLVDLFISNKIDKINLKLICDEVSGERDPRNILVMFNLISKLSSVARTDEDFEYISRTISVYYPIQFEPPENDTIKITPLQLKKSLLSCFMSSDKLGPYSMEILIDSLYSEFSLSLNYTSVISDTLYFLTACKPVYHQCFNNFVGQLIQIMKIELLDNKFLEPSEPSEPSDMSSELYECGNLDQLNVSKVKEIGSKYYRTWNFVDEKVKLFGEIMRLFVDTIHEANDLIDEFLKLIAGNLYSNNSVGYLVDIMCENPKVHSKVIEFIIVPVLKNINGAETCGVNDVLNILVMFIMPKILINCESQISNSKLIESLLCLIDPEIKSDDKSDFELDTQRNVQYLKLLTLSSCIIDDKIVEKLVPFLLDKIFPSTKNNDLNDQEFEKSPTKDEELYFLECLICLYKCHKKKNVKILRSLNSICSEVTESDDFHKSLSRMSYINRNGRQINILNKMCGLFKSVLEQTGEDLLDQISQNSLEQISHSLEKSSDNLLFQLVVKILIILFKSLECLIGFKMVLDSVNEVDMSDMFISYSSLIPCAFENGCRELVLKLYTKEQLLKDLKNLILLYKDSFYNDEKNIIRVIFLTSSVPRIIKYLNEAVESDLTSINTDVTFINTDFKFINTDFRFLNVYLNKYNKENLKIQLNCGNELFSSGLELMNLESDLICGGYFKDFEKLRSFSYFNGSLLVKYALKRYKFDLTDLISKIKLLDNYRVKNLEYEDLFLLIVPISINRVKPIIKYQLIDIRKTYQDEVSGTDEKLLEFLKNKIKEDTSLVPNYQENLNDISKIELYIVLISIMLNKGEDIEVESINMIIGGINEILSMFKEIKSNNGEQNSMEWELTREYVHWCFDKYLMCLQQLLYGVVSRDSVKETHEYFGDFDNILEELINVYENNQVPFSRILTILITNSVMKISGLEMYTKQKVRTLDNIINLVN